MELDSALEPLAVVDVTSYNIYYTKYKLYMFCFTTRFHHNYKHGICYNNYMIISIGALQLK